MHGIQEFTTAVGGRKTFEPHTAHAAYALRADSAKARVVPLFRTTTLVAANLSVLQCSAAVRCGHRRSHVCTIVRHSLFPNWNSIAGCFLGLPMLVRGCAVVVKTTRSPKS